jgi:hypothetical protein
MRNDRKRVKSRVPSIATCNEVKKRFLIMVTEIIKEYSAHPTAFTTMLQSPTNNHLHDLLWKKMTHCRTNYALQDTETRLASLIL